MGKVYATDTILRGGDRPLQAGDEVPDTYLDLDGQERKTNFERLEQLGVTTEKKAEADDARLAAEHGEVTTLRARVAELEAQLAEAEAKAAAADGGDDTDLDKLNKPELEKLAADRGVEVKGTGKDGAVTADDLRKALKG